MSSNEWSSTNEVLLLNNKIIASACYALKLFYECAFSNSGVFIHLA